MRIVIDLQGAQTESRFRGIGRYSLSLARAIARNRGDHEILIALNGLFPETIEPIRAAFEGLLPQEKIRVWHASGPVRECEPGNEWRRAAAERIREAFLASLEPDVVLVTSLFEGFVDDAVTSIGVFDQRTPVAVILYDLIPLLNKKQYFTNPLYEKYYLIKIEYLKRASSLLAISESSAKEATESIGFDRDAVFNISSACDDRFRPVDVPSEKRAELLQKYKISRPFIMCAAVGLDPRKNLDRLIRAFARLPRELREAHQLVIVSSTTSEGEQMLKGIARQEHLKNDELIITGYVTDEELIQLYNLCSLFVFPSWHEGFGLPPLEAMACGAPVIASNATSLPEVVGREDALFDPFSVESIASKIAEALSNEEFRKDLIRHGLKQAKRFSWDASARRAIEALEDLLSKNKSSAGPYLLKSRPSLAYISPLPPEQSGISDYSAELLPELGRYYDIEVVVNHPDVSDPWIRACLPIRSVDYFKKNADRYDRVLYHIGNSPFHQHMFEMLDEFPGVSVLHDFYLGNFKAHMELNGVRQGAWTHALYESHGYKAVFERFHSQDLEKIIFRYPCNFDVIRKSLGIIVHSFYSLKLANEWYGAGSDWAVVPHLRALPSGIDRISARRRLDIPQDAFVVCSFGFIAPTKQNHRLIKAWLSSSLSRDRHCHLIFVGDGGGDYGHNLLKTIRESGLQDRIRITGWVDRETFRSYLEAADIAVQLRTLSRGETSGTILDCMSYGVPLIVNAHGSSAELPEDAVYMLPDEFEDIDLIDALEILWRDAEKRESLRRRAREVISTTHAPASCAKKYFNAIETFYDRSRTGTKALIESIAKLEGTPYDDKSIAALADCIARSVPRTQPSRQIFVDVSAIVQTDLRTGVERVTRSILRCLLLDPPDGYRVEPVYASSTHGYRYARKFTMSFLDCPSADLQDEPIECQAGDVFLGLDLNQYVVTAQVGQLEAIRNAGVRIFFVVYDLLPLQMPEVFPPGTDEFHNNWLRCVCRVSDGVLCISKAVADGLKEWLESFGPERSRPIRVTWFHIGADLESSAPTKGLPENAADVLNKIQTRISFLMVGTVEPRKGYPQVIAAFEMLWKDGVDVNLVIVGREGWKHLSDDMRRNIPETVNLLRGHPELGRRLFWLEGISDEYLERVYAASTCLIAASLGEGFGLPLIEAAQHKLPIIARDIPVFREVAGDHAFYFRGNDPSDLVKAIKEWIALYKESRHPKSDGMPWLTWRDSTAMLLQQILGERSQDQSRVDTICIPGDPSGQT